MATSLKALDEAGRAELTIIWEKTFKSSPPPSTSRDLMRLATGWEVQSKSSRASVRELNAIVRKLSPQVATRDVSEASGPVPIIKAKATLSPGTRLSREWQGRTYQVDVLDKGYAYDGKLFKSLSPIAKAITGVHRSGPLFFGVSK